MDNAFEEMAELVGDVLARRWLTSQKAKRQSSGNDMIQQTDNDNGLDRSPGDTSLDSGDKAGG